MLTQPRLIICFLVWFWLVIIILYLFAKQIGIFHFLLPEDFICLIESGKIFFIIFFLPLLIPSIKTHPFWQGIKILFLFFLIFLPVTVSGAILLKLDWLIIVMTHLLMLFIGFLVIRLNYLNSLFGINLWRWYYLVIFAITGALPLAYYLIAELFHKIIPILLYINPFWLLWRVDHQIVFYQGWMLQIIICMIMNLVLLSLKFKSKF